MEDVADTDGTNRPADQAAVVFYRRRGRWNQQRAYWVRLDDGPIVKMRRGQEVSLPVRPGTHVAKARVDTLLLSKWLSLVDGAEWRRGNCDNAAAFQLLAQSVAA